MREVVRSWCAVALIETEAKIGMWLRAPLRTPSLVSFTCRLLIWMFVSINVSAPRWRIADMVPKWGYNYTWRPWLNAGEDGDVPNF